MDKNSSLCKKEGQVERSVKDLESKVMGLLECFKNLEATLSPVIQPPQPQISEQVCVKESAYKVPIADAIEKQIRILSTMNSDMDNLISRIEL